MIIKKLALHNFGVYASDNVFIFNDEKPVTLIGGMNGRGKTTFLEAVLLVLYGSNSFAVIESNHKYYGAYLRAHVNTSDGTNESFIELEFVLQEDHSSNTYTVTRSWSGNYKHIRDYVSVKKNGYYDEFLTKNWSMFIENILPSALANFYFFDGEKISEIAENDTSKQMKDSIKSLLGINVIDQLNKDLQKVIRKLSNEQTGDYDTTKLEKIRAVKEQKELALSEIDEKIKYIEEQLTETCKLLEIETENFNINGGQIAYESHELYSEKNKLSGQLAQIKAEFIDLASTELPLVMVKERLRKISAQSLKERESKTMKIAVDKINKLFDEYSISTGNADAISGFIDFIEEQTANIQTHNVYNLSDNAFAQLTLLCSEGVSNNTNNYLVCKNSERKILQRLNEVENYLAVDIDENKLHHIYKTIYELENKKAELEVQLDVEKKSRIAIHGEFLSANTDFNNCVEKSLAEMERDDDVKRMYRYALLAQKTADEYKLRLQRAKIKHLAETMTNCFKKLLGKKHLINKIEIDYDTLDYYYIDTDNNVVNKNSLSAGEKQLIVIAMLWALAECSNQRLPIIIDTPLARLDSFHRTALIDKYFPNASKQTIILSTDSEIDSTCYQIIKKYISNEFTLVYDDENNSSHIENGYFKGVIG